MSKEGLAIIKEKPSGGNSKWINHKWPKQQKAMQQTQTSMHIPRNKQKRLPI